MRRLLAFALLACLSIPASAKVVAEPVSWNYGGVDFDGYLVYDKGDRDERPGLVMVPNWKGVNDAAIEKAKSLAGDDYVILLVDMYGRGVRPATTEEAGKAATAVYSQPDVLRGRINAALDVLRGAAEKTPVDASKLGGIGFCFGGAIVLELARSGADVAGVVSFHGNLSTQLPAKPGAVRAPVLALNGADDGFVPAEQIAGFQEEMRAAGVDWQFVNFGGAVHCFTETDEDGVSLPGCKYDARTAKRAYAMADDFLDAVFGD